MKPEGEDVQDVTAPFSVAGGGTHQLVAEFVGTFPGVVPEQRGYPVVLEVHSSRSKDWQPALSFTLQLGNLIHPLNYIVYSNQHDYLSEAKLAEGAALRGTLREQWGLDPVEGPG